MVGTEQGYVLFCNRKTRYKPQGLGEGYQAHYGPVYSLQRNPASLRTFLTVGDWTAKVWSEDLPDSSNCLLTLGGYTDKVPLKYRATEIGGMGNQGVWVVFVAWSLCLTLIAMARAVVGQ